METDRLVRKAGKTFTTWRPWLSIKPSANLAGLLALPRRIAEFSCVPPHNEEEKTVDPDELSTTNTKLLNNYFWQIVIYIYIQKYMRIYIYMYYVHSYQSWTPSLSSQRGLPSPVANRHWGRTMRMPPHMNHWKVTPSKISYFFTGTYLATPDQAAAVDSKWELCHGGNVGDVML